MLLTLPVFAPEVPAVIEFTPAGERHLRLVLAMSRLGMISDDDLAGLRRTSMSASAIRTLIEKGWQREVVVARAQFPICYTTSQTTP